jgi:predicted ester cyclase
LPCPREFSASISSRSGTTKTPTASSASSHRITRGFDAEEIISGGEGYKTHFVTLTTGFPDLRITIRDMQEDNRVVARYSVEATHTGDFVGIPPTGKRVRITGIAIARISNGQLVEEHASTDGLGLMKQLGVIEPPKIPPLVF